MGPHVSDYLRGYICGQKKAGKTYEEINEETGVPISTCCDIVTKGEGDGVERRGGKRKLTPDVRRAVVRKLKQKQGPWKSYDKIAEELAEEGVCDIAERTANQAGLDAGIRSWPELWGPFMCCAPVVFFRKFRNFKSMFVKTRFFTL